MRYKLTVFLSALSLCTWAQQLRLTSAQVEAMFLERNLQLIARRMDVSIADAAIAQARVWDNPEFSIGDVNMWGGSEHPKQFSLELSQMISLSAHRAKLVALEKVGREIALAEFEELLRSLKVELRSALTLLQYNTDVREVMGRQRKFLAQAIAGYEAQYERGNVARSELVRLQTALFVLEGEMNEVQTEFNEALKGIKDLLSIDTELVITDLGEHPPLPAPASYNLAELTRVALELRPDRRAAKLQSEYHERDVAYQRSLAVPQLNLGVKYDRRGGVWENFVGIGAGIQLPIFNNNKGEITKARLQLRQNEILREQGQNQMKNEIRESYDNYCRTYSLLERNLSNPALSELDALLELYANNLLTRNISMVEYMDFMDSYRSTKQLLLTCEKELRLQFYRLQFALGQ